MSEVFSAEENILKNVEFNLPLPKLSEVSEVARKKWGLFIESFQCSVSQPKSLCAFLAGDDFVQICESCKISGDNIKTLYLFIHKIEKQYLFQEMLLHDRYRFFTHTQKKGISKFDFLAELKLLADVCEFGEMRDTFIEERFTMGSLKDFDETEYTKTEILESISSHEDVNDSFGYLDRHFNLKGLDFGMTSTEGNASGLQDKRDKADRWKDSAAGNNDFKINPDDKSYSEVSGYKVSAETRSGSCDEGKGGAHVCDKCQLVFDGIEALAEHVLAHIREVSVFKCKACSESFFSETVFNIHVLNGCSRMRTRKAKDRLYHDELNLLSGGNKSCQSSQKALATAANKLQTIPEYDCNRKNAVPSVLQGKSTSVCGEKSLSKNVLKTCTSDCHRGLGDSNAESQMMDLTALDRLSSLSCELETYGKQKTRGHSEPMLRQVPLNELGAGAKQTCVSTSQQDCDGRKNNSSPKSSARKEHVISRADTHLQSPIVNKVKLKKKVKKTEQCSICGRCFQHKLHLETHIRVHTGEKPFVCEICGKGFAQKCGLKLHHRIHTGEKPYSCSYCEKKFTTSSSHVVHERRHRKDKRHTCEQCGKKFYTTSCKKSHMLSHMSCRDFKCDVCGSAFASKKYLKYHKRTHLAFKPFTCVKCGSSFTRRDNLRAHEVSLVCKKRGVQN